MLSIILQEAAIWYRWTIVYGSKADTIEHMKPNSRHAIVEILLHTLDEVHENCFALMRYCESICFSHMNEIICHF